MSHNNDSEIDQVRLAKLSSLNFSIRDKLESLYQAIVRTAAEIFEAPISALMLLSEDDCHLELVAAVGLPQDISPGKIPRGQGISGKVADSGKPFITDDIARYLSEQGIEMERHYQAALASVPESEAKEIWNILDKQVREATWHDIFFHNLSLSLLTLIPFIGVGLMLFIMFNTGFILGAVSVMILPGDPITRLILVLFVTFVFPGFVVAFFEFGAYTLLLGEVFYSTYLALTKSGAKQRLRKHFWKTLLIYVVMLLIGALIETASIRGML